MQSTQEEQTGHKSPVIQNGRSHQISKNKLTTHLTKAYESSIR